MPRVTVCLSVFNGADTLAEAIESALAQSYRDFEVLVLDDGSTDGSAEVAARYDVRLVRQANAGRGAALARMVELAQGEWCALLDADDVWEATKLEAQAPFFELPRVGLVHTDATFEYPDGRVEPRVFEPRDAALDHILPDNRIVAASATFRRSAMLDAGNFHPLSTAACDWYGWLILAPDWEFAHVPSPLVRYRIREGSIANRSVRFQSGKRHMLRDLLLPEFDRRFAAVPGRERYRKMVRRAIGVAASTIARDLTGPEARALHREALRLAPTVPRVWSRWLRSCFRGA